MMFYIVVTLTSISLISGGCLLMHGAHQIAVWVIGKIYWRKLRREREELQ